MADIVAERLVRPPLGGRSAIRVVGEAIAAS
jgi:hypothetical protein